MSGKSEDKRFRHPETAAHLRSLTAEEAAGHGPMIRRDGDGFLEYRIEDGEVRCRRAGAADLPARDLFGGVMPSLAAELSVQGPDPDAAGTALRERALSAGADACRRLSGRKDDGPDPPPCPECGGRMRRSGPKLPKTFTTRLGALTVERSCCRCAGCGKGLFPLDAWLKPEGRSITPGGGRMVTAAAAEAGSRRGSALLEELSGTRISRSRFDRLTRAIGAEAVDFERKDVPEAEQPLVLPVTAAGGTGVPMRRAEPEGRAGRREDGTAKTREAKLLRICEVARGRRRDAGLRGPPPARGGTARRA